MIRRAFVLNWWKGGLPFCCDVGLYPEAAMRGSLGVSWWHWADSGSESLSQSVALLSTGSSACLKDLDASFRPEKSEYVSSLRPEYVASSLAEYVASFRTENEAELRFLAIVSKKLSLGDDAIETSSPSGLPTFLLLAEDTDEEELKVTEPAGVRWTMAIPEEICWAISDWYEFSSLLFFWDWAGNEDEEEEEEDDDVEENNDDNDDCELDWASVPVNVGTSLVDETWGENPTKTTGVMTKILYLQLKILRDVCGIDLAVKELM